MVRVGNDLSALVFGKDVERPEDQLTCAIELHHLETMSEATITRAKGVGEYGRPSAGCRPASRGRA